MLLYICILLLVALFFGPADARHAEPVHLRGAEKDHLEPIERQLAPIDISVNYTADPVYLPPTGGNTTFTVQVSTNQTVDVTNIYTYNLGNVSCNELPYLNLMPGDVYTCQWQSPYYPNYPGNTLTQDNVYVVVRDEENVETTIEEVVILHFTPLVIDLKMLNAPPGGFLEGQEYLVDFEIKVKNILSEDVTLSYLEVNTEDDENDCVLPRVLGPNDIYTCLSRATLFSERREVRFASVEARATLSSTGEEISAGSLYAVELNFVEEGSDPVIAVTISTEPTVLLAPGGYVNVTVDVENLSVETDPVTIESFDLEANGTPFSYCGDFRVYAAGETYTCKGDITIEGGPGENTVISVNVSARDNDWVYTNEFQTATVFISPISIQMSMIVEPALLPAPGGTVSFTVIIKSNSTGVITITSLTDSLFGDLFGEEACKAPTIIEPGGLYSCSFTRTVTGQEGDFETATVTAVAVDSSGFVILSAYDWVVYITSTSSEDCDVVCIDFDDVPGLSGQHGDWIWPSHWYIYDSLWIEAEAGQGGYAPYRKVRTFDTSLFNTLNPDLGSPNEHCPNPGPGVGDGGMPGEPGKNCEPQGNVVIIQEKNEGVLINDPSTTKANVHGGKFVFTFNAPVEKIDKIGLLNVEGQSTFITVETGDDRPPVRISVNGLGDNAYQNVTIGVDRALKMIVDVSAPTGISLFCYCPPTTLPSLYVSQRSKLYPDTLTESQFGTFVVHVSSTASSEESPITLTSLVDSYFGDLNGNGNCSFPVNISFDQPDYVCEFSGQLDAGWISTSVKATGINAQGTPVVARESMSALGEVHNVPPSARVSYIADPRSLFPPGGEVNFTIEVTNDSGKTDPITVTGIYTEKFGNISCGIPYGGLLSYDTLTCDWTATVSSNFSWSDKAHVSFHDNEGTEGNSNAESYVDVSPGLVELTVNAPKGLGEGEVSLEIDVNVTNLLLEVVTLTEVSISGLDGYAEKSCALPSLLQPHSSYTCHLEGWIIGDAHYPELLSVSARGTVSSTGEEISLGGDNERLYFGLASPTIAVYISADPSSLSAPGGYVNLTVEVNNTSGPWDPVELWFVDLAATSGAIFSRCSPAHRPIGSYTCFASINITGHPGDEIVVFAWATGRDNDKQMAHGQNSTTILITTETTDEPTLEPTPEPSPCGQARQKVCIDFSQTDERDLVHGDYVEHDWFRTYGMNLAVTSFNGGYTAQGARVFDTARLDTRDPDLGSPNEQCSPAGPGVGLGGVPGTPGENCAAQGNVLIIQQDNGPDDTDPDDNAYGGTIEFMFDDLGRKVLSIGMLDVDSYASLKIRKNDGSYKEIEVEGLGDNAFQEESIGEENVSSLEFTIPESGAVSYLCFCDDPSLERIAVELIPAELSIPAPGQEVTFLVKVKHHAGDSDVTITTILETSVGDLNGKGTCSTPQTIAPNREYSCTFPSSVTGPSGTTITKILAATGINNEGISLLDTASAVVSLIGSAPEPQETCIRFDETPDGTKLNHGDWVKDQWFDEYDMMIIAASTDGGYTPDGKARIFDTSKHNTEDPDLESPNESCGGTGVGAGGVFGAPGENCEPQGNIIIIQEHPEANEDFETLEPDDNAYGGSLTFTFDKPVAKLIRVGLMDIEVEEVASYKVTRTSGAPLEKTITGLGDNSVQEEVIDVEDVTSLKITVTNSIGVRYICFQLSDAPSCEPTTGSCVSTFADLEDVASRAVSNDVIALCGGEILTESAVVLEQPNLKLCCSGAQDCVLRSTGNDRNLLVTGNDFTVEGISFLDGVRDPYDSGGNVMIEAGGDHVVRECEFVGGKSSWGGNLSVRGADSLTIKKTLVSAGEARYGGGLAVDKTPKLFVEESVFEGNDGGSDDGGSGGGVLANYYQEEKASISFKKTTFKDNMAEFGAGYLATTSGMTSLSMLLVESTFESNVASGHGGAGVVLAYRDLATLDLTLQGNTGSDNVSSDPSFGCSEWFLFFGVHPQQLCIGVSEDYRQVPST